MNEDTGAFRGLELRSEEPVLKCAQILKGLNQKSILVDRLSTQH